MRLGADSHRQMRWIPYFAYVAVVTALGVALFTVAGRYWSDTESIALQVLCWGIGSLVWLIVYVLADAFTAITLDFTGGVAQNVVAAVLVFACVASVQFLVLRGIVWLIRRIRLRTRHSRPEVSS